MSPARRLSLVFSLALLSVPALAARELADYRLGDTVEADIVTPVPLDVIDADATAARKEQEALKTPAIFRCYSKTTNDVENHFVAAFSDVRARFLTDVALVFRPIPLDETTRGSEPFASFVAAFNRRNEILPVTALLAQAWAGGNDGLVVQTALVSRLRQGMRRHIREDDPPENPRFGDTLRLVPVTELDEPLTLEGAEQRGRIVTRTSVATLSRARTLLQNGFPESEQPLARAVAAFLEPDCFLDEPLTQQARARQIEQLAITDHFAAGQVVARRGQVIDPKLKTVLDLLHDKTAVGQLSRQILVERAITREVREHNRWLLAALTGVSLVTGLALWQTARRRRQSSLLPVRAGHPADEPLAPNNSWRQRALNAERRADKVQAMVRADLMPQLAQMLKDGLVQGLASQRAELLETQQQAAHEINDLLRRLNELQTPVQERLRTYEKRIEDLERALAARNEEYHELLKLKIEMTRRQAEAERANPAMEFS